MNSASSCSWSFEEGNFQREAYSCFNMVSLVVYSRFVLTCGRILLYRTLEYVYEGGYSSQVHITLLTFEMVQDGFPGFR